MTTRASEYRPPINTSSTCVWVLCARKRGKGVFPFFFFFLQNEIQPICSQAENLMNKTDKMLFKNS